MRIGKTHDREARCGPIQVRAIAMVAILGWCAPVSAMAQFSEDSFELRPGVVIYPSRGLAYVMAPGGGIDAIGLADGQQVWRTEQAAKPLAVAGEFLLAQAEGGAPANSLQIVWLDPETGEILLAQAAPMPEDVEVSIDEGPAGTFDAAIPTGSVEDAFVRWTYHPRQRQGLRTLRPARSEAAAAQESLEGAVYVNLAGGSLTAVELSEVPGSRDPLTVAGDFNLDLSGVQFLSRDERHVAASERVADDRTWEKYEWRFFDADGAEPLPAFRTHVSRSPFFIQESRLYYETRPYVRAGSEPEPAKLRAIDLVGGTEAWSVPIRNTDLRGGLRP